MRVTVKLPRLGETVDEVVVIEWLKGVGDEVAEGEALLSVDTAKVESEVPAPVAGRLVEQLVKPDDELTTGDPVAVLDA
jgi:glutaconyl-CoA/methylmalonyl-CoA decarboxylase subunit gamma